MSLLLSLGLIVSSLLLAAQAIAQQSFEPAATAMPAERTTHYGDDTSTTLVLVPLDGAGSVAAAQAAGLTLYGRYSGPRG